MGASQKPLFLARRAYRRRRMMDASRLLPLAGLIALLLPALWQPAASPAPDTAWGLVYIFTLWALLIVAAAALGRGLRPALSEEEVVLGARSLPPIPPSPAPLSPAFDETQA